MCVLQAEEAAVRAYLKSRTELWWAAMALPALVLAHWMVVSLGPLLLRLFPIKYFCAMCLGAL